MTFTSKTATQLRTAAGTAWEKIAKEFRLVDNEIDTLGTAVNDAKIKIVDLTPSMVSASSLGACGVDLAVGTGAATNYAVWMAPVACTIVSMDVYFTEAYVKETGDASIVLQTEAAAPVTKVTYTVAAAGVALRAMVSTAPSSAALAAGTLLNLVVTPTSASTTGAGRAKVFLRYTVD